MRKFSKVVLFLMILSSVRMLYGMEVSFDDADDRVLKYRSEIESAVLREYVWADEVCIAGNTLRAKVHLEAGIYGVYEQYPLVAPAGDFRYTVGYWVNTSDTPVPKEYVRKWNHGRTNFQFLVDDFAPHWTAIPEEIDGSDTLKPGERYLHRVHIEANTCATARSRGWADPQIFEARTDGLTEAPVYIYPNVSGERGQALFFRYPRSEEERELFDSWALRDEQVRQNRVEKDGPLGADRTHPHFRTKRVSYPDAPCQIRMSDGASLGISWIFPPPVPAFSMPQSVDEFRTLPASLPEGTFREEAEFYVRILEILDAPDDFVMETALKRLENWLAQRPFPQKISMLTRFEIPGIRKAFFGQENKKIKGRANRIRTSFGKMKIQE